MNEEQVVVLNDVSKRFGKTEALSHISASIPKGKLVGLVGPDGSGKTTLLRLIAGLLTPTEGTITVLGFSTVLQQEEISHSISYMPQKFGLYEDLTVLQNLVLYATLYDIWGDERERLFKKLLNFTRLSSFQDRLAGALSGGMKQKLGLACTLIRKPQLLLLDEPSVGVDPISRRELWSMVRELIPDGISVIWSTAYLDEAERCDTVLLLSSGKVLYDGNVKEVTDRVQGRTFTVTTGPNENKRKLLEQVLPLPQIVDATIQGDKIRVVLDKPLTTADIQKLPEGRRSSLQAAEHRFEDAFIDILGGSPKEPSLLAQKMDNISSNDIFVQAEGLTKRFGSFIAADNITFSIRSGEIFGLLGPNGAGKSTTFKMMCGLLKPSSGEGFVNGVDLLEAPAKARAQLGYMAQKFSLYGNLSVWQNLQFFAGIYNLAGVKKRQTIEEMIETFHLHPYLDQSADELPLGFKQRLALSCAVMHKPKVLFLDEPTSGVDPITRREFWGHINGLVQKGMTIMVTTHFMDEAEYCDRIVLIYQGKIIAQGTPDHLKTIAQGKELPNPSLEDAFIAIIEQYDRKKNGTPITA